MEPKKRYRFTYLCSVVALALYCERCYAGDCPADGRTWVPFAQSCYHFVHGEENVAKSYTFESAKEMCRGYELLSIKSPEENSFIEQYSPQVWKGNINMWLDMYFNSDSDTLQWHDNSELNFVNWENNTSDKAFMDTCAALHSSTGKWTQVSCAEETENGVVCKTAQVPEKKESGDCPADGRTWVPFAQSCYHFVHGEENVAKSYTFESAKEMCRGYELLSIKSPEENSFIEQYSPQVWKGNINVWLDMYFNSDSDTLQWHDNSELNFVNWENNTSDKAFMDTCAALHSSTGKWTQVSCAEETENGVVCKTAQVAEKKESGSNSPVLSALVVLSVLVILGVSAVLWFLHQRHNSGSSLFTSFEYHPPFRSPLTDEASLVDAEETEDMA